MKKPSDKGSSTSQSYYELEVIPGLADFARTELNELAVGQAQPLPSARDDRVRFRYAGHPARLLQLRRSVAVSRVKHFDIPRPKALLGHQDFEALIGLIGKALALHEPGSFKTFHISAAGSQSSVFSRIKEKVAARTGLECVEEAGDLLLTVRRPQRLSPASASSNSGWEVAVRLSPRPLAARRWRVCNMPGALNGAVASTMMRLTRPSVEDRVINLACGSGTLLIERLALGPVQRAVGCDIDATALDCARTNLVASGHANKVTLLCCDAGRVPLSAAWATTVCVDLPFGMLLGSHQSNAELYPRLLAEAGRLTMSGAWLVTITQEARLFQRVASGQAGQWKMVRQVPIKLPASTRAGTIRPRIYLLQRR
jgi:16S rRNA G966 N2-methylase RsmD